MQTLKLLGIFWIVGIAQACAQTGNLCGPLIRQYEVAYGIPHKLLTAIALVESGRKVGGSLVPWAWTINANGTSYVFASKKEAVTMVRQLRQLGIASIDVGCMQVNLKQHPAAFPTLEAAFDPATNIAYAAKFLKAKKMNKGSWVSAVAHYHSSTAKFHAPYKAKVLKTWAKVQKGQILDPALLKEEISAVEIGSAEFKNYEGAFVENVTAPSGPCLPIMVQFAPYKKFQGGVPRVHESMLQAQGDMLNGPKIIRGRPKGSGKIIINSMAGMRPSKPFHR